METYVAWVAWYSLAEDQEYIHVTDPFDTEDDALAAATAYLEPLAFLRVQLPFYQGTFLLPDSLLPVDVESEVWRRRLVAMVVAHRDTARNNRRITAAIQYATDTEAQQVADGLLDEKSDLWKKLAEED